MPFADLYAYSQCILISMEGFHMLVKFTSKAVATIVMLPVHAQPLLQAAGKEFDVIPERGVFTVEQLPTAIAGIEAAARQELPPPDPDEDEPKPHPIAEHVSIERRAFPLLDMMRRSLAQGENVMWELNSSW